MRKRAANKRWQNHFALQRMLERFRLLLIQGISSTSGIQLRFWERQSSIRRFQYCDANQPQASFAFASKIFKKSKGKQSQLAANIKNQKGGTFLLLISEMNKSLLPLPTFAF